MPAALGMTGQIEALLPHAGAMVLIDEIVEHDRHQVHCRAHISDLSDHPLACHGVLPAVALVEYAAQAMAVHGTLVGRPGDRPSMGRLVALPVLDLAGDRIKAPVSINVHVKWEGGDGSGAVYAFRVVAGRKTLASGRAAVMFVKSGGGE